MDIAGVVDHVVAPGQDWTTRFIREEHFLAPAKAGIPAKPFVARPSAKMPDIILGFEKQLLEHDFKLSVDLSSTSSASKIGYYCSTCRREPVFAPALS